MEKHLAQFNPFLKDTSFVNLMARRVFNVLLVANPYDAFMLEDDGRIDEKIFEEYTRLGLRYPPRFTQVSTQEEATEALAKMRFELVICMPGTDNSDAFDIGRGIKESFPDTPLVVLLLAWHHPLYGKARPQSLRVCLLLAGQYRAAALHHQAYGGQDESRLRHP